MVKIKRIILVFVFIIISIISTGWFDWVSEWDYVYISYVNQHDVSPSGPDVAPEVDEAKLPISIKIKIEKGGMGIPIQKVILQYSTDKDGETWINWQNFGPEYSDEGKSYKSEKWQGFVGKYQITDEMVSMGSDIAVRVYFANIDQGNENADLSINTTADGTNGWKDQWVVSMTTETNKRIELNPGSLDRGSGFDL